MLAVICLDVHTTLDILRTTSSRYDFPFGRLRFPWHEYRGYTHFQNPLRVTHIEASAYANVGCLQMPTTNGVEEETGHTGGGAAFDYPHK
jgi:hypothetical protein